MKICPKCRVLFEDDTNYCLSDGSTLKDFDSFDHEDTISFTDEATLEFQKSPTAEQNKQTNPTFYGQMPPSNTRQTNPLVILGGVFALGLLLFGSIIGGAFYFIKRQAREIVDAYPTPTPYQTLTPSRTTPTPEEKNNIKVEILEKADGSFGQKFLKCKITNLSEHIVFTPNVSLSFYQDDVKIKDASGTSKLKFLKPNQTVPVWINIYGVDKYTSVKVNEPVTARAVSRPTEEVFPALTLTETEMKGEKGGLSYNFKSYIKIFYKVSGIVEKRTDEKNSPALYVLYKDENDEIIGVGETSLSGLKVGEKTKFEISVCEIDLFGIPKSFEIVAVNSAVH